MNLGPCEPTGSSVSTPGLLPILGPPQSHSITLIQEELLVVSRRTSLTVSRQLTLSLSPLIAILRRGLFDEGDSLRNGRMSSTRQRFAPQHRDHGNRLSIRSSMNKPAIDIGDAIRSAGCRARRVPGPAHEQSPARPLTR